MLPIPPQFLPPEDREAEPVPIALHLAGSECIPWAWTTRPLVGEYIATGGRIWKITAILRGPKTLHCYASRVSQSTAADLLDKWNAWCQPAEQREPEPTTARK